MVQSSTTLPLSPNEAVAAAAVAAAHEQNVRHCLCLVCSLSVWLRHCLCLVLPLPSFSKALPLPCASTAVPSLRHCLCLVLPPPFFSKTLPLPYISTAFVAKALPFPCASTASLLQDTAFALCFHRLPSRRQCLTARKAALRHCLTLRPSGRADHRRNTHRDSWPVRRKVPAEGPGADGLREPPDLPPSLLDQGTDPHGPSGRTWPPFECPL